MSNPRNIEAFGAGGELRMIVETPRGSAVKLKYDLKLKIFTVSKSLPLGLTYPFDWGFIPGTQGEDGDPWEANPRFILMPLWHDRLGEFEKAAALPHRL